MKNIRTANVATVILLTITLAGCHSQTSVSAISCTKLNPKQTETMKTPNESASNIPLAQQLSDKAQASAAAAPQERLAAFQAGIELLRESGIEQSAKQVGDRAVDCELIGWDGQTVKLSELWSEGPIILMWYRGGWCPYCSIQLRAMQQNLEGIDNAGARLVVLTPELPEKAKETAEANNLDLVALHDRDNQLAKQYGIMFDLPEPIVPIYRDQLKLPSYNGSDKLQLPLAATYVIDQSGKITYAFLDSDYKKRADPTEVLNAVKHAVKHK